MSLQVLDNFDESLSWNQTFYGVPLTEGGYVWGNCLHDILNYPGRVAGGKVLKSCWGDVRLRLLAHADS